MSKFDKFAILFAVFSLGFGLGDHFKKVSLDDVLKPGHVIVEADSGVRVICQGVGSNHPGLDFKMTTEPAVKYMTWFKK